MMMCPAVARLLKVDLVVRFTNIILSYLLQNVREYLGLIGKEEIGTPFSVDCFLLSGVITIFRALLILTVRVYSIVMSFWLCS